MSVIKRIEEQLDTLRKIQAASPGRTGVDSLVTTLQLAQARIERMQREIDQRLPSQAEIALQLLPAVITRYPDAGTDEVSQIAFAYAKDFIAIKEQQL